MEYYRWYYGGALRMQRCDPHLRGAARGAAVGRHDAVCPADGAAGLCP